MAIVLRITDVLENALGPAVDNEPFLDAIDSERTVANRTYRTGQIEPNAQCKGIAPAPERQSFVRHARFIASLGEDLHPILRRLTVSRSATDTLARDEHNSQAVRSRTRPH